MSEQSPSLKSIADAAEAERPKYFEDPRVDDLLAILLETAEENCVLQDRLKSAEKLSPGLSAEIDSYRPSQEETAERIADHSKWLNALMSRVAKTVG